MRKLGILLLVLILLSGCAEKEPGIINGKKKNVSEELPEEVEEVIAAEEEIEQLEEELEENISEEELALTELEERARQEGRVFLPGPPMVVDFIDLNDGESILIKTPEGKYVLIDGGGVGKGPQLVSFLRSKNVSEIEVMIASSIDDGVIGGLSYVLFNFMVYYVYDNGLSINTNAYDQYMGLAKNRFYFPVPVDNRVEIDTEIEFDIIVPYSEGDYNNESGDNSLIVRLNYRDITFLFTGNCGLECEKDISYAAIDAEILKIAQHGSNKATSGQFLDRVNPSVAVIWGDEEAGLPSEEVLERLEGVQILRPDLNGTVEIVTDGVNYNVSYLGGEQ